MTNTPVMQKNGGALAARMADLALQLRDRSQEPNVASLIGLTLLDAIAAAAAGFSTVAVRTALDYARETYAPGAACLWFLDAPGLQPSGATFVNSTSMSALDIDDGNRAARGHVSAAVIPAVLAVGEVCDSGPADIAHAVLAGCEIGARLGVHEDPAFYASGRWAGVGAAAAAGCLLGLDSEQLGNAISLAIHTSPILGPAGARREMTGHVKEGVAFGALVGVNAALLARSGYRGDPDAAESVGIYDTASMNVSPEGELTFSRTYFKLYACCRLAHSPIDAILELLQRHRIEVQDIESIRVDTFTAAIELPNESKPSSLESAQYSLPFCIATALRYGADALLPLNPERLNDPAIAELAERVQLTLDHEFDAKYPASTPSRITIRTTSGVFTEARETADGDPSRPFSSAQIHAKLRRLANLSPSSRGIDSTLSRANELSARAWNALLSGTTREDRN